MFFHIHHLLDLGDAQMPLLRIFSLRNCMNRYFDDYSGPDDLIIVIMNSIYCISFLFFLFKKKSGWLIILTSQNVSSTNMPNPIGLLLSPRILYIENWCIDGNWIRIVFINILLTSFSSMANVTVSAGVYHLKTQRLLLQLIYDYIYTLIF